MNVNVAAFDALAGGTVSVTPGITSSTIQIQAIRGASHVRVYNADSTHVVYIEFGGSGVTASTATSMPIAPGEVDIFSMSGLSVAVITSGTASTNPIYFTPGEGMD